MSSAQDWLTICEHVVPEHTATPEHADKSVQLIVKGAQALSVIGLEACEVEAWLVQSNRHLNCGNIIYNKDGSFT